MIHASASITLYNKDMGYLFLIEMRNTVKDGPKDTVMIHPPGGKIKNGENIFEAALREFEEEIKIDLLSILSPSDFDKNTISYEILVNNKKRIYHTCYIISVSNYVVNLIKNAKSNTIWLKDSSQNIYPYQKTSLTDRLFYKIENDKMFFFDLLDELKLSYDDYMRQKFFLEQYLDEK